MIIQIVSEMLQHAINDSEKLKQKEEAKSKSNLIENHSVSNSINKEETKEQQTERASQMDPQS